MKYYKEAICITAFDSYSYNVRIKYVEEILNERGYQVSVVASNFEHLNKKEYKADRSNLKLITCPSYKKNISFKRIYSHYVFAKRVYTYISRMEPDLIFVSGPPNLLYKFFAKYKRLHNNRLVIFDIVDLWPETFPIENLSNLLKLPFYFWKKIRDDNLENADLVIFECDLFREFIKSPKNQSISTTLYLCKDDVNVDVEPITDINKIRLVYLGSINNIIDIDLIVHLLKKINVLKPVELHVIGDGENKNVFVSRLTENGVSVIDWGTVFEDEKKQQILSQCSFGLNIMKNSVVVGATMKSIDYLRAGVPMINSIRGDTEKFVEEYHCGFNMMDNIDVIVRKIIEMNEKENYKMRVNARKLYEEKFSSSVFKKELDTLLDKIE